jgi:hypothetical protein
MMHLVNCLALGFVNGDGKGWLNWKAAPALDSQWEESLASRNEGGFPHIPLISFGLDGDDYSVSMYPIHHDKVGNFVCLYLLLGVSYNFVAVESKCVKPTTEDAKFDKWLGSYKLYKVFKADLSNEEGS